MKRLTALMLFIFIVLCQTTSFAVPSAVSFRSTYSLLELLEEQKISYEYRGINQQNEERINIEWGFEDEHAFTMNIFISDEKQYCVIQIWNLINFSPEAMDAVVIACNDLNSEYRFCNFTTDPSDYSVTASYDLFFTMNSCSEICYRAIMAISSICAESLEYLADYAI